MDIHNLHQEAHDAYGDGDFKRALARITELLKVEPKQANHWNFKGAALLQMDECAAAIQALERALDLQEDHFEALLNKSEALRILKSPRESLEIANRAMAIRPENPAALRASGVASLDLGNGRTALEVFERALEIDPDHQNSWEGKGRALRLLKRPADARDAFRKAVELDDRDTFAWVGLGNALADLEQFAESVECFDNALKVDRAVTQAWVNKGHSLRILDQPAKALEAFQEAIATNARNPEGWYGKGITLRFLNAPEQAMEALDEAIRLAPAYAAAWSGKGVVLQDVLNHPAEALKHFEKAIELDPVVPSFWFNLSISLHALGDYDGALSAVWRSVHLGGNDTGLRRFQVLYEQYNVPYFLKQLIHDTPMILSLPLHAGMVATVRENCRDMDQLLYFVTGPWEAEQTEKLALEGLIYHFMGTPLLAAQCFQHALNLKPELTRLHFYLLTALDSFHAATSENRVQAVSAAEKHLADCAPPTNPLSYLRDFFQPRKVAPDECYYAGQILFHEERYKDANTLFAAAGDFLPALYMAFACARKLKEVELPHLERILNHEGRLKRAGRSGMLDAVSAESIDFHDAHWNKPFTQYANAMELGEIIQRVRDFALTSGFPIHKDSRPSRVNQWRVLEKSRALLFEKNRAFTARQMNELKDKLRSAFPVLEEKLDLLLKADDDEKRLNAQAALFLEMDKRLADGDSAPLLAVAPLYFVERGALSSEEGLYLYLYACTRIRVKGSMNVAGKMFSAGFVSLSLGLTATLLGPGAQVALYLIVGAPVLTALTTGVVALLEKHFQPGTRINYAIFKERIHEFLSDYDTEVLLREAGEELCALLMPETLVDMQGSEDALSI